MGKEATVKDRTKRPIIVWVCKMLIKSKQMYLLSTFNKKVIGLGEILCFIDVFVMHK